MSARFITAALLLALLTACGGGDPEPDRSIDPPKCQPQPKLCS